MSLLHTRTIYIYIGQPSLLGNRPKLEASAAIGGTLWCSWIGSADDFIDYYTTTIASKTALLLEKNTTELSAAITTPIACGATYECSVVPTNMLGRGKIYSAQTFVPCPTTQGKHYTCNVIVIFFFFFRDAYSYSSTNTVEANKPPATTAII